MQSQPSQNDTRERLLKSAIEVFAEHGYEAATIREICRRAQANVAAVHYHFGDKKRLYTAIFDTVFSLLRQRRTGFLPAHAPADQRLRIYIRALFEEIFFCDGDAERCTQLSAIYLAEMTHPTEVLDSIVAQHMRRDAEELYAIVATLLQARPRDERVVDCAASVVGQILYYYHAEPMISRLHPKRPPVAQRLTALADHVWRFSLGGILSQHSSMDTSSASRMRINDPMAYREADEAEVIAGLMDLKGCRVLELGCGAAWMTRLLVERFKPASIVATEVDRIQHDKNLTLAKIPGVDFRFGGAEAIDQPDESIDAVFMFKSLHHVPQDLMIQALREIHRVLVPGGHAYLSEPVYWGEFNEIMRLIHDEKEVREAAFQALSQSVDDELFELEAEVFFQSPGTFESWDRFEQRFLKITHTELAIDEDRYARIRSAFMAHMTPAGAHFLKPHRVDLLRKRL